MAAKIVLGPEYDEALHAMALSVLREMGAEFEPETWALAGSQEIVTRFATLDGKWLKLETETYIGLSLSGDEEAVAIIAAKVLSRMDACGE